MAHRKIKTIRIHPAIGIARLGNSLDSCFIGPEIPGVHPDVSQYRDQEDCLKRQGARFRLFAYDANDSVIGEINCRDRRVRKIEWTVHLRNTKAAGQRFEGILNQNAHLRNERFSREHLILDPGPHSITLTKIGISNSRDEAKLNAKLKSGPKVDMKCSTFMNKVLSPALVLGTLLTDDVGRLVVLGGHGISKSPIDTDIDAADDPFSFANHDDWYDDTSDGYIRAKIDWDPDFKGNVPPDPLPSWVIVAPPKYAPSLECIITLYDVLFEKAIRDRRRGEWEKSHWMRTFLRVPAEPIFSKDIHPVLRRAHDMKWVFARAEVGHETEIDLKQPFPLALRQHIVRQFREPSDDPIKPGSGTGKMPYIWSDLFDMNDPESVTHPVNATLTKHQFQMMNLWASGRCKHDRVPAAVPKEITPEGLDRAALDPCVGAALFPGIETSFHIRDKFEYVEPFRLDASKITPGDATQQMSVPWQSDFVDCNDGDKPFAWWPTQRPIDVHVQSQRVPKVLRWARDFNRKPDDMDPKQMLIKWWRLGLLECDGDQVIESHRVVHMKRKRRPKSKRP